MECRKIHFEIPADDVERAKNFYSGLFGWRSVRNMETECGMVLRNVVLDLCGCLKERDKSDKPVVNYFGIDSSIDEYHDKIVALGGRVIVPKVSLPRAGHLIVCLDTENNVFRIFQEDKNAK